MKILLNDTNANIFCNYFLTDETNQCLTFSNITTRDGNTRLQIITKRFRALSPRFKKYYEQNEIVFEIFRNL